MALCNTMAATYAMANSGVYDGDVTTDTDPSNDFYRYTPAATLDPPWHFTLGKTGAGNGEQRSMGNMHFSVTLGGVVQGHIYFSPSGVVNTNLVASNKNLPPARLAELERYYRAHTPDIDAVCACMASMLV